MNEYIWLVYVHNKKPKVFLFIKEFQFTSISGLTIIQYYRLFGNLNSIMLFFFLLLVQVVAWSYTWLLISLELLLFIIVVVWVFYILIIEFKFSHINILVISLTFTNIMFQSRRGLVHIVDRTFDLYFLRFSFFHNKWWKLTWRL